jgi:hypothetical protein
MYCASNCAEPEVVVPPCGILMKGEGVGNKISDIILPHDITN